MNSSGFYVGVESNAQARPLLQPEAPPEGLVSILVACCGQLEYTRLCVPSLLCHSRPPFEIVFLDAGSIDGTSDYLAGLAAAAPVPVQVVRVSSAFGAAATEEEILHVVGDFVALLNNDTIVTQGWLDRLTALAAGDGSLGMVAPMSNYAPPPLLVERVPYKVEATEKSTLKHRPGQLPAGLEPLHQFARDWAEQHRGVWHEAEELGGGCVLLKRHVIEAVGVSPTRTALGAFDLEGLSRRVRQAGYRLAACGEQFVHHFGSRNVARA